MSATETELPDTAEGMEAKETSYALPIGWQILFYGLYYVMTGLHGLHVLAGLVLLGCMLFFTIRERVNSRDFGWLENSGLYWHLVDLIWIYLFPLFYLIT